MPKSATGSSGFRRRRRAGGFTLIELLIVIAIVAVSAGLLTLALRDGDATKLEEEAVRLTSLLEMARAEARVTGTTVRWVPASPGSDVDFRFVGLSAQQTLPVRWLDPNTSAQIAAGVFVVLGPEAILPPQRIVLRLGQQRLELASDGLAPFAVAEPVPQ